MDGDNLPSVQRPDHGSRSLLPAVIALAKDPDVNVEKLKALLEMQERLEDRQAEAAFKIAMNAAQAEIAPVARNKQNTQTRSFYATLDRLDRAIRPIYIRHGFSISYSTVEPLTAGNIRLEARCSHVAGHTERYYREAPADVLGPKGSAVKTQLHGAASTETFLRRYLNCGIFNVVFVNADDDGVAAADLDASRFITDEQIAEINALIRETQSDSVKVLAFADNAPSVPEMTAVQYQKARDMLLRKKNRMAREAEAQQ